MVSFVGLNLEIFLIGRQTRSSLFAVTICILNFLFFFLNKLDIVSVDYVAPINGHIESGVTC